jgi:hypothetical protein
MSHRKACKILTGMDLILEPAEKENFSTMKPSHQDKFAITKILALCDNSILDERAEVHRMILTRQQYFEPLCKKVTLDHMIELIKHVNNWHHSQETEHSNHLALRSRDMALLFLTRFRRECEQTLHEMKFRDNNWNLDDTPEFKVDIESAVGNAPSAEEWIMNIVNLSFDPFLSDDIQ